MLPHLGANDVDGHDAVWVDAVPDGRVDRPSPGPERAAPPSGRGKAEGDRGAGSADQKAAARQTVLPPSDPGATHCWRPFGFRGSLFDRLADADIGHAAAQIAGHDRSMSWSLGAGNPQQRRRLHDLAGLAVTALRHLQLDPGLLQRMRPSGSSPSIVVMSASPTLPTGVMHDRVARPPTWTVQAPHMPMPQPNFVPVSPTMSRITHSSGVSSSASIATVRPLMDVS